MCIAITQENINDAVTAVLENDDADTYGAMEAWDTSNITDFSNLFKQQDGVKNISNWDTSSGSTMKDMFYESDFVGIDISAWDTSKVITMEGMFKYNKNTVGFNENISAWVCNSIFKLTLLVFI